MWDATAQPIPQSITLGHLLTRRQPGRPIAHQAARSAWQTPCGPPNATTHCQAEPLSVLSRRRSIVGQVADYTSRSSTVYIGSYVNYNLESV